MPLPPVTFELTEKYLLITGHGTRDSLTSMAEASAQIYRKMQETNSRYLLVDYRKLQINVHLNEAFNIVKRYEVIQPGLKDAVIAAVFEKPGLEFGNYWKEIALKRGFFIEIFEDMKLAEEWLLNQMTK
ncbi:hypothetical protein WSM22_08870 [Cytophagales bacterium WSM2-2]|nr:hypothetical protein WSM22_08870 [Cytophagales bacterium WSM2-2]